MRRVVFLTVAAVALGGATAAFAAGLGVTAAKLTSWSSPSTVPTSSCTLGAVADSHVENRGSGNQNFGGSTELNVENGSKAERAFLRFDVASCVPSGARVTSAQLSLYLVAAPSGDRTWELFRVTASWTESVVTWSNQPAVAASATGGLTTGTTSGVTLTYPVTADVQAFVGGTANHGWRVSDLNEGSNPAQEGRLSSREAAANQPSLAITFYP